MIPASLRSTVAVLFSRSGLRLEDIVRILISLIAVGMVEAPKEDKAALNTGSNMCTTM
jgi:hypothetical protein